MPQCALPILVSCADSKVPSSSFGLVKVVTAKRMRRVVQREVNTYGDLNAIVGEDKGRVGRSELGGRHFVGCGCDG